MTGFRPFAKPDPASPLRLGTRASPLALAQAVMARDALCARHGWSEDCVVLVPMTATGDRIQDRALADVGGKALWTKELDAALDAGRVDIAVHSMKDVETIRPTRYALAAMLPRADVRDRLIVAPGVVATGDAVSLDSLPRGARVGTSSPRRTAQVLRRRPDLSIVLLRGNVATRLDRVARGDVDATLLAAAGLNRLGLTDIGAPIATTDLLPAASQGAVGIECLADRDDLRALVAAVADAATVRAVTAERDLLEALGGDCRSPVAALATHDGDALRLSAALYSIDGGECVAGDAVLAGEATPAGLARDLLGAASPAITRLFAG